MVGLERKGGGIFIYSMEGKSKRGWREKKRDACYAKKKGVDRLLGFLAHFIMPLAPTIFFLAGRLCSEDS